MYAFHSGKRTTAAVASGIVVGLTALTGGIAPAVAAPGDDPGRPTTAAEPEPILPAAPSTTTVVETPAQAPAPRSERAGQPEPQAPVSTEAVPTAAPASTPAESAAVPEAPAASAAPVTTSAAPVEPAAPAEPVEAVAEPTTSAVSTTAPTTTAATAAPTPTPAATTPTLATEPSPTEAPAPVTTTTTAPATVPAPAPPGPAVAEAPSAPVPSAHAPSAVQDAAAPDTPAERRDAPSSVVPQSGADPTPVQLAEKVETPAPAPVREVLAPQTLEAPEHDVVLAKSVKPIEHKPDPAPQAEVAELAKVIDLALPVGAVAQQARIEGARVVQANSVAWDRNIRQWRPDWVRYDQYYRPVIANPYRDPVRIVYMYQNAPRMVLIPPLQSVVMEVAQLAAYSFTAVVVNAVNTAVNVAVGSFFGGGYIPAVGLPLPPPPRPVLRYDNVPIQVRYTSATYEPFVVRQIVDVGDDPQYGGHKVLLDGVTPVWGQWVQNPAGQRQFEVYKTQQFPGLDAPAQAPLPGDYRLRLAADTVGPESNDTNKYLAIAAATAAGLSLSLVGVSVYLGRRRPLA
jgi:hypothetical protein